MKLTFTPPDGPVEEYDFIPGKLLSVEAEAIEDLKGARWDSFEEFGQLFLKGNAKAHRAALWIMKRRVEPGLRFEDLTFEIGALRMSFTDEEARKFEESIRANPDLDEEQKNYLVSTLDLATHDGELRDGTDLKDESPTSGPDDSPSATPDSPPA